MNRDYFDLVDCDSFGLGGRVLTAALEAVKYGGLLYVTNTDGKTSAGKNQGHALAEYGAWPVSHAGVNEQGLRLLVGAAARAAAPLRLQIDPVFCLFARHGPCFRAMLRVTPCRRPDVALEKHYGFTLHCPACGQGGTVPWRALSGPHQSGCECAAATSESARSSAEAGSATAAEAVSTAEAPEEEAAAPAAEAGPGASGARRVSPELSGPLWLGPLHDQSELRAMAALARELGWRDVLPGLDLMLSELEPALPPFYYSLRRLHALAGVDPPPRPLVEARLRARGFSAARPHADPRHGLKTDAPVAACVEAMRAAAADIGVARSSEGGAGHIGEELLS